MSNFVKIEQPTVDLSERATSRTLLQFRKSSVFLNVLQSFVAEINRLQGAIVEAINKRGVAEATGVNLDAIGRIVGQDRTVLDFSELPWFTPDDETLACDMAPAWVTGAATGGSYAADDVWYRELIAARIFRNFTMYSSVYEIQTVLKEALDVDVSFERVGPMEIEVIVNQYTPLWVINFIIRILTDPYTETVMFAPFAATTRLVSISYLLIDESSS